MKLLAALITTLLAANAGAADLSAELTPLVAQPRPAAPEWVEVKLAARGSAVRTGVLEIEARNNADTLYRYRTHELAIAGQQRFRFLLPPTPVAYNSLDRSWRLIFVEGGRVSALGDFPAPITLNRGRSLVLGVVRGAGSSGQTPVWQALRLERFLPAESRAGESPQLFTSPVFLDADELPADPLGYCAFDALLLAGDALASLREKSRDALARWVHAGGSLAIIGPQSLDEPHLTFLNELVAPDPRVRSIALPLAGTKTARADFGSLLLAAEAPPETLTPEWRQAVAALWNVRAKPLARLATVERWNSADFDPRQFQRSDFQGRDSIGSSLVASLLPRDVRPLPLGVLFAILGAFLIAIGPLDWFVLGTLRRRRLTWIIFPCLAIGCTALTTALARGYLGQNTRTGHCIVTDLGTDGRVVRETRFALTLPAREGELAESFESALSTQVFTGHEDGRSGRMQFAGQFPARYRITRPGRQWLPAMTRATSLSATKDTSGIAWRAFPGETFDAAARTKYFDALRTGRPITFDLFWRGSQRAFDGPHRDSDWRRQLTLANPRGSFTMLSRIAPSGSAFAEDCPVLDEQDKDTSIVLAARQDSTELHIWRHLFLH